MNDAPQLFKWLRSRHRGCPFAVLLLAGWAPLLLPQSPLWTAILMGFATALFFVMTGLRSESQEPEPLSAHGSPDAKN